MRLSTSICSSFSRKRSLLKLISRCTSSSGRDIPKSERFGVGTSPPDGCWLLPMRIYFSSGISAGLKFLIAERRSISDDALTAEDQNNQHVSDAHRHVAAPGLPAWSGLRTVLVLRAKAARPPKLESFPDSSSTSKTPLSRRPIIKDPNSFDWQANMGADYKGTGAHSQFGPNHKERTTTMLLCGDSANQGDEQTTQRSSLPHPLMLSPFVSRSLSRSLSFPPDSLANLLAVIFTTSHLKTAKFLWRRAGRGGGLRRVQMCDTSASAARAPQLHFCAQQGATPACICGLAWAGPAEIESSLLYTLAFCRRRILCISPLEEVALSVVSARQERATTVLAFLLDSHPRGNLATVALLRT